MNSHIEMVNAQEHDKLKFSDEYIPAELPQSEMSTYENCISCCGSTWGCLRAWLPCCCCCCPYPFLTIETGYVGLLQEFGRFRAILPAGMHQINPCSDKVVWVDMKTYQAPINALIIISKDSITSVVDAVIYYRVVDPVKATYRLERIQASIKEVAHSVIRTVSGEYTLQEQLTDKIKIQQVISDYVESVVVTWGIYVEQIHIKDQKLTNDVSQSLSLAGTTLKTCQAKLISAQANVTCAKFQSQCAELLNSKAAMQIRSLETIKMIAQGASRKVLMMNF